MNSIAVNSAPALFWLKQCFKRLAVIAGRTIATEGEKTPLSHSLNTNIPGSPDGLNGQVSLVGAGPGDADLLTVKAVKVLAGADVILFDDLASGAVLELCNRRALKINVGKRGYRKSWKQDDINQLMLSFACAGKHVVRLKSGDPMIFGRAGEEISFLEDHGISVSVIPGITAALAMASQLRVSLTHRDCAQSVRFVTGHAKTGELPKTLDWASLANSSTTVIFYMGGRKAAEIGKLMMLHGAPGKQPVAIMAAISSDHQEKWVGSLDDMENGAATIACEGPLLIGIGSVFAACGPRTLRGSAMQGLSSTSCD